MSQENVFASILFLFFVYPNSLFTLPHPSLCPGQLTLWDYINSVLYLLAVFSLLYGFRIRAGVLRCRTE